MKKITGHYSAINNRFFGKIQSTLPAVKKSYCDGFIILLVRVKTLLSIYRNKKENAEFSPNSEGKQ